MDGAGAPADEPGPFSFFSFFLFFFSTSENLIAPFHDHQLDLVP
jgi:hypothetical protein